MNPAARRRAQQVLVVSLALAVAMCTDNTGPSTWETRPSNPKFTVITPTGLATVNPPQVFVGAGDMSSCGNNNDEATAKLLDNIAGTVFTAGDNVYQDGTASEFTNCYEPTWGRHKARTKPVPGNHDYNTSGGTGYFNYFGSLAGTAGQGYYSYDLGAWHIIALNSEISKTPSSPQMQWLRADLAAHPNLCTAALWHEPLYSSTSGAGSGGIVYSSVKPLFDTLYAYGADLILNGHRHFYERIAPIKPDGTPNSSVGVREMVVGMGGIGHGNQDNVFPASEVRNGSTYGVLKLYLYDDSYAWKFVPIAGQTFTDSGSTACHTPPASPVATSVAFVQQPTNAQPGATITPAVTVEIRDQFGARMTGATNSVSLAIGTNPGSGTLSGTTTRSAVNGLATFSGLSINNAGTGYTLTASSSGLTGATSSTFNIVQSLVATSVAFVQQPTNTQAGASITPAVTVEIRDQFGARMTGATNSVTLAIGTNPGSGTLGGTTTQSAVNGLATFSGLSINNAGTGYTLTASSSGLTGAISSSFNITAAPPVATSVAFVQQPTNTQAGANITPAVTVEIRDQFGARMTGATNSVTLAIGTNPGGGTLSGTKTQAAVNGLATFSGLSIDNAGTGYTLTASSSGLTGATSSSFDITAVPPVATSVAFVQQPTNTQAGDNITPAVTVEIRDQFGTRLTTATNNVTLAIGTNPGSGTLGGTKTQAAVNGLATFPGLSIDNAGTGYTLTASSSGLTGATSSSFDITAVPPVATSVAFVQQPTTTDAGASITPAVTVEIRDQFGARLAGATNSVTLAIGTNPGSGTLGGTKTQAAVNGLATFSGLSIDNPGTGYTLTASSSGLTGATSSTFNITEVLVATSVAFVQQPTTTQAGANIAPAVTVEIQDQHGARLTGATNSVTLAIGTNPGSGTLGGTKTQAAVNGLATFSGLSIDNPGTGYTLTASSSGLTGATSSTFNITEVLVATSVAFVQQPTTTQAGANITPAVTVEIQDQHGARLTGATNSVTLAIGTNPGGGTLSGTKTQAAVNGLATFPGLSIDNAGTGYTLTASSSGLTGATSSNFDITAAPPVATSVAFVQQPTNTQAGDNITPAVTVEIRDQFGARLTGATNSVTLAIGTNPGSGTLGGTKTQAAVNGLATFPGLSIDNAGTGYTLTASSSGLTGATSSNFDITAVPPVATSVAFVQQPTTTDAGASITPAVTVEIRDQFGARLTTATNSVTLAIGTNPGSGTLGGTKTQAAVNGLATFPGLSIDNAGTGYTLTASSSGLTGATSNTFNITEVLVGTSVAFVQQPTNTQAGASITPAVTVEIRDQHGARLSGATNSVTLAIGTNPSGGTLGGTKTQAAVNGLASFSGLSIDNAGSGYTLTASSTGLTGATSSSFNITAPPAGITHTLLTAGNNLTNQNIYTTAAIAPAPNTLVTIAVLSHRSTTTISPTVSGGGMASWTLVATVDFDTLNLPHRRLSIYRAMSASPGSGPITFNYSSQVSNVEWIVSQWSGVETSGTNGAGAIGQSGSNRADAGTGLSVALSPFGSAANVAYGVFGVSSQVLAVNPGAGFTEINEQPANEAAKGDLQAEWGVNQPTINATWVNLRAGALGVEIIAKP